MIVDQIAQTNKIYWSPCQQGTKYCIIISWRDQQLNKINICMNSTLNNIKYLPKHDDYNTMLWIMLPTFGLEVYNRFQFKFILSSGSNIV